MFDYSADVIKVEQVDRGDDTSASMTSPSLLNVYIRRD